MKNNFDAFPESLNTPAKSIIETDNTSPVLSSLSSSSETGSESSSGSKSSGSRKSKRSSSTGSKSVNSKHEANAFYRNALYGGGSNNHNYESIEDYFGDQNDLANRIKEIVARDFRRINSSEQVKGSNLIRASLLCYRKGENKFQEIKIEPVALDIDIAQEKILNKELPPAKASITAFISQKSELLNELTKEGGEVNSLLKQQEYLDLIIAREYKLLINSSSYASKTPEGKKTIEGEIISIVRTQEFQNILSKEEKTIIHNLFSENDFPKLIKFILDKIEHCKTLKKDLDKNGLIKKSLNLSKEIDSAKFLLEKEDELIDVIRRQRGHSEDYLYQSLVSTDYLSGLREMIDPQFDRFFLVTSSTRESCNRCSHIMEEIQEILSKSLCTTPEHKLRVLYFSQQQLSSQDEKPFRDYHASGKLSDSSDDEYRTAKAVINFSPIREEFVFPAFEICAGKEDEASLEKNVTASDSKEMRPSTPPTKLAGIREEDEISPERMFKNSYSFNTPKTVKNHERSMNSTFSKEVERKLNLDTPDPSPCSPNIASGEEQEETNKKGKYHKSEATSSVFTFPEINKGDKDSKKEGFLAKKLESSLSVFSNKQSGSSR